MSKRNFVCFKCRFVVREEIYSREIVPCPLCQQATVNLGYKIPIPQKNKHKEWTKLEAHIVSERLKEENEKELHKIMRKHEIEQELIKLEKRPSSKGLNSLIKKLKVELGKLK